MSKVIDLCDRWDALAKGPHPTTIAIREAYEADVADVLAPILEVLAKEWYDEPPTALYPEGRRLYRWPTDLRAELLQAVKKTSPL